jgi:hypothetical protein
MVPMAVFSSGAPFGREAHSVDVANTRMRTIVDIYLFERVNLYWGVSTIN